jgi:hypothetical protein
MMKLTIECEREIDGRWIAEIVQVPGAIAYGATRHEAMARAKKIAVSAGTSCPSPLDTHMPASRISPGPTVDGGMEWQAMRAFSSPGPARSD